MVEHKFKNRLMLTTAFNNFEFVTYQKSYTWCTAFQLLQIERELWLSNMKVHWNHQLSCSFSCPIRWYGHETNMCVTIMRTIFKYTRITLDPQVFLGIVPHTQIVDDSVDERPGFEASFCGAINYFLLLCNSAFSHHYCPQVLPRLQIVGAGLSKPHTSKLNWISHFV